MRGTPGPNPVWLVFVAPGLLRGWLLFHTMINSDAPVPWLADAVSAFLLLALLVLTWFFATDLADAANLSQRAKERFLVMATLSATAPPLSIAVAQTSHWGSFTAVEVVSLWGLRASFRLLQRRQAGVVTRDRWYSWVFSCLLGVLGLWLIGLVFAVYWPLDSRRWLALSVPGWQTGALTLLSLALLCVLAVLVCGLLLAISSSLLSFWGRHSLFIQLSKLVGVSLLFCASLLGAGALMWVIHGAMDGPIYVLQAFALTIPVCNAAFFALPYLVMEHRKEHLARQGRVRPPNGELETVTRRSRSGVLLHGVFLALLSLYFWSQLSTYVVTGLAPH